MHTQVFLACVEAVGPTPGDGVRYPDHPVIYDPVENLVRHDGEIDMSPQDGLTIDILYGQPMPRALSDARETHMALGKGPKGNVAEQQFEGT